MHCITEREGVQEKKNLYCAIYEGLKGPIHHLCSTVKYSYTYERYLFHLYIYINIANTPNPIYSHLSKHPLNPTHHPSVTVIFGGSIQHLLISYLVQHTCNSVTEIYKFWYKLKFRKTEMNLLRYLEWCNSHYLENYV